MQHEEDGLMNKDTGRSANGVECFYALVHERSQYRGGGLMVGWNVSLMAQSDAYEKIGPYEVPYARVIGDFFLMIHDNARHHTAQFVEYMLGHIQTTHCS